LASTSPALAPNAYQAISNTTGKAHDRNMGK
jgi:hypothetical protein